MTLDEIGKTAGLVSTVVTVLAVFVGGAWAVYHFFLKRVSEPNPQIELDKQIFPYGASSVLLIALIRIRNIGLVPVLLLPGRSFTFSLKVLPKDREPGTILHWNDGQYVVQDLDVVREANPDHKFTSEDYWLEPGAEYQEVIPIVVPSNSHLMAQVCLKGKPDIDIWTYRSWFVSEGGFRDSDQLSEAANNPIQATTRGAADG